MSMNNLIKKKSFLFWLFALFIVGCSEEKIKLVEHSSPELVSSLSAVKVEVPPVLFYPRSLILLNDRLIVFNEKTDTLFLSFSLDSLAFQHQFGIRGQGANDFVLPSIQPVSCGNDSFTLCDLKHLKSVRVEENDFYVHTTLLPYDYSYYNGLVKLGDSLYCCHSGFEDDKEMIMLYSDGTTNMFSDYPEKVYPRFKNALARNQAYNRLSVAKPDGSRMAVFYQHVHRWRLFNNRGELLNDNVMDGGLGELPEIDDRERYIHTVSIYGTDKYIYTLNLGMKTEEIMNQEHNPYILVFDWDGKPVKQYQLDCFISTFAVDEVNDCLYGVFIDDIDHIYKFDLK